MKEKKTVILPDMGLESVKIVAWLKVVGDICEIGDPLLSLEGDKMQIDLPSTVPGRLVEQLVAAGDHLGRGQAFAVVQTETVIVEKRQDIILPDIGLKRVKVVGIWVEEGASISRDQALLGVESDKAQIDVPSPMAGHLWKSSVSVGDELSVGDVLGSVQATDSREKSLDKDVLKETIPAITSSYASSYTVPMGVYASPLVRKKIRENNLKVEDYKPSGNNNRLSISDISDKRVYASPAARRAAFEHGIDVKDIHVRVHKRSVMLSDVMQHHASEHAFTYTFTPLQRATAKHIENSWFTIPHVTHGDEVVVTELEALRKSLAQTSGLKMSLLPCVIRAVSEALLLYPKFASRLTDDGKALRLAPLQGINIAMDTPEGLIVPRLDGVGDCSLRQLLLLMDDMKKNASLKTYAQDSMLAGSITISSLGSVGGRWFTPIINAPQVAIIGVMRGFWKPEWQEFTWVNTYSLPIVLSYDHRAVDGLEAQKFLNEIGRILTHMHEDPWMVL